MMHLPTAWQQFFNSRFRYWPARTFMEGKPYYKTNSREWAKQ